MAQATGDISLISTHSLTRRLTTSWIKLAMLSVIYFNSQPHKEADSLTDIVSIEFGEISTHSLTRRLTSTGILLSTHYSAISTHSLTRRLTMESEVEVAV